MRMIDGPHLVMFERWMTWIGLQATPDGWGAKTITPDANALGEFFMAFYRKDLNVLIDGVIYCGKPSIHISMSKPDRMSPTDEDVNLVRKVFLDNKEVTLKDWARVSPLPVLHLFCFDPPQFVGTEKEMLLKQLDYMEMVGRPQDKEFIKVTRKKLGEIENGH